MNPVTVPSQQTLATDGQANPLCRLETPPFQTGTRTMTPYPGIHTVAALIPGFNSEGFLEIDEVEHKRYGSENPCVGENWETGFADVEVSALSTRYVDFLEAQFQGYTVVDFGAGPNCWGYWLACYGKAAGYIAVEAFHYISSLFTLMDNFPDWQIDAVRERNSAMRGKLSFPPPRVPCAVAPEDATEFIRRLPNASVAIMELGMHNVLNRNPGYLRYHEHFSRVQVPGSDLFLPNSYRNYQDLQDRK